MPQTVNTPEVTINVSAPLLEGVTITASKTSALVNETITFTVSWRGGSAPYTVTLLQTSPTSTTLSTKSASTSPVSFSHTFTSAGSYVITASVRDSAGATVRASSSVTITISQPITPLSNPRISASKTTVSVNESFTITILWDGGKAPYTVELIQSAPTTATIGRTSTSSTSAQFNVTATTTGTYRFYGKITDSS